MANLRKVIAIRFNRKSGKIDTTYEALGTGIIRMWALENTTKTKDTIIFDKEDGQVLYYYEGKEGMPTITDFSKEPLGYIDDYCPGLLRAVQDEEI